MFICQDCKESQEQNPYTKCEKCGDADPPEYDKYEDIFND